MNVILKKNQINETKNIQEKELLDPLLETSGPGFC